MTILPSNVDYGQRAAAPFIACFGRFERDLAAAIYVEACAKRGDTWQSLGPREFGETMLAMKNDPPSWLLAVFGIGIFPDMLGLVEGGWFTIDAEKKVQPTDLFFSAIADRVRA